MGIMSSPA